MKTENANPSYRYLSLLLLATQVVFSSGCTGESATQPDVNTTANENPVEEAAATPPDDSEVAKVELCSFEELQAKINGTDGRVVVVDFWSTSCIPCMRELPHLVELAKQFPDEIECISFNLDYIGLKKKPAEKYVDKVQEFLQSIQADITNLLSTDTDEFVIAQMEAGALPAVAIYNQTGKLEIVLTDGNTGEDGLTYEGDVVPKIRDLLAQGTTGANNAEAH